MQTQSLSTDAPHRLRMLPVLEHSSPDGSIVTQRRVSVRAGQAMMRAGGNAVDAAVAAALVAGVVEPGETTLAGSGFMLIDDPHDGPISIEFGPIAPLAARSDMFESDVDTNAPAVLGVLPVRGNANADGGLASGVPRTLLALIVAQERYGVLPLATVLGPAIQCADTGFEADAYFLTSALHNLDRLLADPGSAEIFLERGLPPGPTSLRMPVRACRRARVWHRRPPGIR